jgi:hypothetical protein
MQSAYRHVVGGALFGSEIAVRASFDAILISSLLCGIRRPSRIMPAHRDDHQSHYAVVSWRTKSLHLFIQKFPVALFHF